MKTMMTDLADRGLVGYTLWMPRDNIPARSLYEQLGGKLIGQREVVRGNGKLQEVAYGWPKHDPVAAMSWPELPYAALRPTADTLQLWAQIVGKVRLARTPWVNHGWHVPLYVSARGLDHVADRLRSDQPRARVRLRRPRAGRPLHRRRRAADRAGAAVRRRLLRRGDAGAGRRSASRPRSSPCRTRCRRRRRSPRTRRRAPTIRRWRPPSGAR